MTEPLRSRFSPPSVLPERSTPERPAPGRWRDPGAAAPAPLSRLVVRRGDCLVVVRLEEVDWIEGAGNYVRVHTGAASHLHRQKLGVLAFRLDPTRFARIHRSTIVNLDAIAAIAPRASGGGEIELRDGSRLAVSRRYRRELLARVGAD